MPLQTKRRPWVRRALRDRPSRVMEARRAARVDEVMDLSSLFVDAVWSNVTLRWYHPACADEAPKPWGAAQATDDTAALCGHCNRPLGQ